MNGGGKKTVTTSEDRIDFVGLDPQDPLDIEFRRWFEAGIAIGKDYSQSDMFELYHAFRAGWFRRENLASASGNEQTDDTPCQKERD